ncbi:hypothetical protein L1887_54104 [Cichorium endivia]|nr:hypothetical protein L1887_54104 [Cichorium endivia]
MQIVADAKRRVEQEGEEISDKKDLLSLLVKSNLGAGAADRMTDREIGGQIQTFMFAGYETSSVTTSWALYFLSRHPDVQQKLRDLISATLRERKGVGLDDLVPADLGYDDVWCDELRYLDWVLAETLRLCPPVPGNDREAARDAVLPLMTPVTLKDGRKISQLRVPKGARCDHRHQNRQLRPPTSLALMPTSSTQTDSPTSPKRMPTQSCRRTTLTRSSVGPNLVRADRDEGAAHRAARSLCLCARARRDDPPAPGAHRPSARRVGLRGSRGRHAAHRHAALPVHLLIVTTSNLQ